MIINKNNKNMRNNQLRTGNLVLHKGDVKTIDAITLGEVIFKEDRKSDNKYGDWVDLDEIEFIPLTEEWLVKLGFHSDMIRYIPYKFYQKRMITFNKKDFFCIYGNKINIDYVNQIQNLFFAITAEELIYKP